MNQSLEDRVREGLTEIIAFVQASERIRALLTNIKTQSEEMLELAELDPELLPELDATAEHMSEAIDALSRAQRFLGERMNAKMERL